MKKTCTVSLTLLIFCLTTFVARADLSDPYEILQKHYQAIGGVERIQAIKTRHVEGSFEIEGSGLEGTSIQWTQRPIRSRLDIDLTVLKITEGDNGEFSWEVDQNGKIQINRDERSLKERQIETLLAEFEHLNRNSPNCDLNFEGTGKVNERDCYVVRMTNSINDDVITNYYDKSSFYLLKAVVKKPDEETHTLYSDYREVDGVVIAFREETTEYPTKMKYVTQTKSIKTNMTVDPSVFEPPAEDVVDFTFLKGSSAENIPFKFIENHIFLEIEVGGKKGLWCLDSGASVSVVLKTFADALGLEPLGTLKGRGTGGVVDFSLTVLPAFELPGIKFNEQNVAMLDLTWTFSEMMGVDAVGILGFDFLSRLVTKIDYANELISFYHPDHFNYEGPGVIIQATISQANHLQLPVTIDGKYGGIWRLDTGAGGMWFHYPFAEKHGLLEMPGIYGMGAGAGGSGTHLNVQFKTMEFAGWTIQNPVIAIPLGKGEGGFADEALTGNIGNSLLRHFVIYLDYAHEKVIVERGDNFGKAFPRNNSGLQIKKRQDGDLEVIFVAEGTPASKAGFQAGDIIRSVNGIDSKYLGGLLSVKEMLREKPGTKYQIEVIREEKAKKLKLVLKDLYER